MNTMVASGKQRLSQRLFRSRAEDALPLTLAHQRIYILPTRRGLAYLFSLLIMLIASINYSLSLGYALSFMLTGLFAASLLHTYRNVAGVTVSRIAAGTAFAGDKLNFDIELFNNTALPRHNLFIKSATASTSCDVLSDKSAETMLSLETKMRGTLPVGRLTLTSTYPVGLWRSWCYVHSDAAGIVFPAPEMTAPPLPVQPLDADGDQQRSDQQGDVAGLRDYRPGDSPGSIAWKTAARGQGLFTRTFENEKAGSQTTLTLAATGLGDLEQQLSRLCAWVLSAHKLRTSYVLELPGAQQDEQSAVLESSLTSALQNQQQQALNRLALYKPAT